MEAAKLGSEIRSKKTSMSTCWDRQSEKSSLGESCSTQQKFGRVRSKLRMLGRFSVGKNLSSAPKVAHLENTYQLEPDADHRFSVLKAEQIIHSVLEGYLKDNTYDPKRFPVLCKTLAELIKERVKLTGVSRYKIIATVTISEKSEQCMKYVSRCLWDSKVDNYATVTYEGPTFIAVGTVYAVYYD